MDPPPGIVVDSRYDFHRRYFCGLASFHLVALLTTTKPPSDDKMPLGPAQSFFIARQPGEEDTLGGIREMLLDTPAGPRIPLVS
jgi:hypothetical protein